MRPSVVTSQSAGSHVDVPTAVHDVFVSRPDWVGVPLEKIATADEARAVFLRRIMRRGQEIPIGTRTTLERGDVVQLTGPEAAVLRAAAHLGEVVHPTDATDFVTSLSDRTAWEGDVRLLDGRLLACKFRPLTGGATLITFRVRSAEIGLPRQEDPVPDRLSA